MPILYVIATGARAAGDLPAILPRLKERGWTCCVTLSPDATKFVDQEQLADLSGFPVRVYYKEPDEPDVHPAADCFLVAPLTFNSLNMWADGHSPTLVLGLLNEALGMRDEAGQPRPIVAVPWVNRALANHPAVAGNLSRLRKAGVTMVLDNGLLPEPGSGAAGALAFPWEKAVAALPEVKHNSA